MGFEISSTFGEKKKKSFSYTGLRMQCYSKRFLTSLVYSLKVSPIVYNSKLGLLGALYFFFNINRKIVRKPGSHLMKCFTTSLRNNSTDSILLH